MRTTRLVISGQRGDYLEIQGSDGKARVRSYCALNEIKVTHILESQAAILQVVNALLLCLFSEAQQADIPRGENEI